MGILAEQVDHVIGVDTHRDSHSAAIIAAVTGAVVEDRTVSADAFGHKRLLRFAELHATGAACGRSSPAAATGRD